MSPETATKPAEAYGVPELVGDIETLIKSNLSEYGLIEGIGRKLKRAIRNPALLTDEQRAPKLETYARHYIHVDPQDRFSLMALVWSPGQGTPVHDHGIWGVIGIYENEIEAINYKRLDDGSDEGYADLRETGSMFLGKGSLCWVLPPNEEIHVNRNHSDETTITLHVYGKAIRGFNVYNVPEKTVRWVELAPMP
ncbi:MAG: cysteine dioxygenase family protein [Planctomycetota bacterium]|jgi:predicted metal-dependent enzyme (double-stranded beta helix superfamily)